MSARALLYAAEKILTDNFPAKEWEIDVKFDARPPFSGPDKFIAIWCGQHEPGPHINMEQGLDELFGATFTITHSTGIAPPDRIDEEIIYKACLGVEYWSRRVIAIMTQKRWDWICLANEIIEATLCDCDPYPVRDGFQCPPVFAGADPTPRVVGPDWLSADPDEDDEGNFAVVMDVRFRDAERIQVIEAVA